MFPTTCVCVLTLGRERQKHQRKRNVLITHRHCRRSQISLSCSINAAAMGQTQSTAGRQLLSVVQENNTAQLRLILQEHPGASCYATCIDRNSPLLLAAGGRAPDSTGGLWELGAAVQQQLRRVVAFCSVCALPSLADNNNNSSTACCVCMLHKSALQTHASTSRPRPKCQAGCGCFPGFLTSTCLCRCAGRGHARMVQAILEAAVISQGLTRAKKRCINHSNSKGQSALMLACIHG